jgi:hypothetical protein
VERAVRRQHSLTKSSVSQAGREPLARHLSLDKASDQHARLAAAARRCLTVIVMGFASFIEFFFRPFN